MLLLAGDVGGTKTDLAVFSPAAGPRAPLVEASLPSADYSCLEALLQAFLSQVDLRVERAVLGVAGPVVAGRATITNLLWEIDENRLQKSLGISSVHLLNDLAAIASAVPFLEPSDLHTLNEGRAVPGGTIAVIAPGTGLGEAFLTWDGARYRAYPSEGGHTDFAPTSPLEVALLHYLQGRFERVSTERVCSGMGLPNLYAFLRDEGYAEEPAWLAEQLAAASDATPLIVGAALQEGAPELCTLTLRTFVSILGAEAGNLALKVLATGGVYLGGGIPPRILRVLAEGSFLAAFRCKGRLTSVLTDMPVKVILNPKAALLGAACHGLGL